MDIEKLMIVISHGFEDLLNKIITGDINRIMKTPEHFITVGFLLTMFSLFALLTVKL